MELGVTCFSAHSKASHIRVTYGKMIRHAPEKDHIHTDGVVSDWESQKDSKGFHLTK